MTFLKHSLKNFIVQNRHLTNHYKILLYIMDIEQNTVSYIPTFNKTLYHITKIL